MGIGPTAGAVIGGGLGGLSDGSKSSKQNQNAITSAQQAQVDASNRIIDLQEQRYGDATRNLNPTIGAGNAALDQISALLGLPQFNPTPAYGSPLGPGQSETPWGMGYDNGAYEGIADTAPTGVDWAAFVNANPGWKAQWDAQTPDLASFGGDINKFGAFTYANHLKNTGQAVDLSPFQMQQQQAGGQTGTVDPNRQQSAIDALKASPLYQSLFGNGRDAILGASSATGGLRGGNVNAALGDFGRDTLAQVIQQQLANLGGIQAQGQSAASSLAGFGSTSANAIGSQISDIGSAQAGGILNRQAVANANDSSTDNILGSIFNSVGGLFGGGGSGGTAGAVAEMSGFPYNTGIAGMDSGAVYNGGIKF